MKTIKRIFSLLLPTLLLFSILLVSCQKEEMAPYVRDPEVKLTDEIDKWFYENFLQPYNCVVRWKWDDSFVDPKYYVSPPKREVMIPVGKMVINYWMEPFIKLGGAKFIKEHFPPEIVCVGSPLMNADGTVTMGYAEAGVRITLTDLNKFDIKNKSWIIGQLRVIHHEFTHIIHQKHGLPDGYELITKENYIGNAWVNLEDDDAIKLGMVTPYGSSDQYEDFCELISLYLTTKPADFDSKYIKQCNPDDGLNAGRELINKKLESASEYYALNFGIKLDELRKSIQDKINN